MVHGVKDYWVESESHVRSVKYMAVIFVFLILVLAFLIHVILFHPVTDFEAEPLSRDGLDFVTLTAVNDGKIKEEFVDLTLNVTPFSECRASSRGEGCESVVSNRIFCNYLNPGEHVSLECPLPENGTILRMVMRSKYQTTKLEFSCSLQKCHETVSYLYGTFPVLWNYLLAYPADRIIEFYNSFTGWLWG